MTTIALEKRLADGTWLRIIKVGYKDLKKLREGWTFQSEFGMLRLRAEK